jgi:hypothetical protein
MLTRDGKREFIDYLVNGIHRDLLTDVERTPEHWDGNELRQWIVDRFKDRVEPGDLMHSSRLRRYKTDVLIRNL